jgi:hypothetical protein
MNWKMVQLNRTLAGAGLEVVAMKLEQTGADLKTVRIDQKLVGSGGETKLRSHLHLDSDSIRAL